MARDPEGHAWSISQLIREMQPDEWGAVAG
jgi:hypothetical protein